MVAQNFKLIENCSTMHGGQAGKFGGRPLHSKYRAPARQVRACRSAARPSPMRAGRCVRGGPRRAYGVLLHTPRQRPGRHAGRRSNSRRDRCRAGHGTEAQSGSMDAAARDTAFAPSLGLHLHRPHQVRPRQARPGRAAPPCAALTRSFSRHCWPLRAGRPAGRAEAAARP